MTAALVEKNPVPGKTPIFSYRIWHRLDVPEGQFYMVKGHIPVKVPSVKCVTIDKDTIKPFTNLCG